jgi:hypothetical protein
MNDIMERVFTEDLHMAKEFCDRCEHVSGAEECDSCMVNVAVDEPSEFVAAD